VNKKPLFGTMGLKMHDDGGEWRGLADKAAAAVERES
jgi:hypothetical protein